MQSGTLQMSALNENTFKIEVNTPSRTPSHKASSFSGQTLCWASGGPAVRRAPVTPRARPRAPLPAHPVAVWLCGEGWAGLVFGVGLVWRAFPLAVCLRRAAHHQS